MTSCSDSCREEPQIKKPLIICGYSKLLSDKVVRRIVPTATTQIADSRHFNVYGPREQHKGRMVSVAFHHFNQFRDTGQVRLFGEYGNYAPDVHSRDFYLPNPQTGGIVGSGRMQPLNNVAVATVNASRMNKGKAALPLTDLAKQGFINCTPYPEALKYQHCTQADLARHRATGCGHAFANMTYGIKCYVWWLAQSPQS